MGYYYFIESEAVQQNWLHTPANIDLDNFTEGTHYCEIEMPRDFQKRFSTGITITHLGSADFDIIWGNKFYNFTPYGLQTTIANAELVEKFFMSNRHTDSSTFIDYYLVIKYNTTPTFVEFTDFSDNRRQYLKCIVTDGAIIWSESEKTVAYVRINTHSNW